MTREYRKIADIPTKEGGFRRKFDIVSLSDDILE